MPFPPCGCSQEKLDLKGWVDDNQRCKAHYENSDGDEFVCGKLYTSHPSIPAPGVNLWNHLSSVWALVCYFGYPQPPLLRSRGVKREGDFDKSIITVVPTKKSKKNDSEILHVHQFPPMQNTNDAHPYIYVRKCYGQLFDIIMALVDLCIKDGSTENFKISGNPGIGKSRGYLYFFQRIVDEGLFNGWAHFILNSGENFHVYENGVFRELKLTELVKYQKLKGVVRLIDGASTSLIGWSGINLIFMSPKMSSDLRTFSKDNLSQYYMPCWSEKELLTCRNMIANLKDFPTEDQVKARFKTYGGIPRIVFGSERNMIEWGRRLGIASSRENISKMYSPLPVSDNCCSHLILELVPGDSFRVKTLSYKFLSDEIAEMVTQAAILMSFSELTAFVIAKADDKEFSSVRGILFERLLHNRMKTTKDKFTARPLDGGNSKSMTWRLSNTEAKIIHFNKITDLPLILNNSNAGTYFIPNKKNFPAVDSLYWNGEILSALQSTVSMRHPIIAAVIDQLMTWSIKAMKGNNQGKVAAAAKKFVLIFVTPNEISANYKKQSYVSKGIVMDPFELSVRVNGLKQYVCTRNILL